jgi:hypothetical protein
MSDTHRDRQVPRELGLEKALCPRESKCIYVGGPCTNHVSWVPGARKELSQVLLLILASIRPEMC